MTELTRIDEFKDKRGTWWAKRDDLACYAGPEWPSGSKVRQFKAMMNACPGVPVLVGCSAHSAMQIYVAAAGKLTGRKAMVYTAARSEQTEATKYAKAMGAELNEERPAYLNVIQSRAAARAKTLDEGYVRWDEDGAVDDAVRQTAFLPDEVKRIVVSTGSGLTAAGVLAGMALHGWMRPVHCVAVSPMADVESIKAKARAALARVQNGRKVKLPKLTLVRAVAKYDQWEAAVLPNGDYLDPYYAAKALRYVRADDLLWLPGLRPWVAVPEKCRIAIDKLRNV